MLRRLNEDEQRHICRFIRLLVTFARDNRHPMREVARLQIAYSLWHWTADAVDTETGAVVWDGIKHDVDFLFSSLAASWVAEDARDARAGRRLYEKYVLGLRHEHVVPRTLLAQRMIEEDMELDCIYAFLSVSCKAVILTKEEYDLIQPRDRMPAGWNWGENLYQRYIDAGCTNEFLVPPGNFPNELFFPEY